MSSPFSEGWPSIQLSRDPIRWTNLAEIYNFGLEVEKPLLPSLVLKIKGRESALSQEAASAKVNGFKNVNQ